MENKVKKECENCEQLENTDYLDEHDNLCESCFIPTCKSCDNEINENELYCSESCYKEYNADEKYDRLKIDGI